MKRERSVVLASLLCLAALASACGSGDESGPEPSAREADEPRAIAVISSDLIAHPRADPLSEQDTRCMARVVVDALGIDRLEELGLDIAAAAVPELTVPPMSETEGDAVYAAFDRCLDFTGRDVGNFTTAGLSASEARCASDHFRASPLPRTHLLLRHHDSVPHGDLHTRVEALWEEAQAVCRG